MSVHFFNFIYYKNNRYTTFAGALYETNMIDLVPGKVQYKYRVGGYDSANQTIRRSKDFNFVSAPVSAANDKTVFAMLADQVILLYFFDNKILSVYSFQLLF